MSIKPVVYPYTAAVLLHGPPGSGKSALAAYVAQEADFAFSKVLLPDAFLAERHPNGRQDLLTESFDEARKHRESLLLLDDVVRRCRLASA